ncbi:MAG TPA: DUF4390 domain-containing protein [Vicinamibacterales bacterium]|nr:DUF4390 domain-containing protein [Vicinamibacterales bacterium]
MIRRRLAVLALLAALPVAVLVAAGDVVVTPLVIDGRVLTSFTATGTFDEDAQALLKSGLPVTFNYTVLLRRPAVLWFDGTLARADVSASAKYDTLSDTYQVSKLDGDKVTWSESTRNQAQVGTWLTTFEKIPLEPSGALEPNAEYYVQVRLQQRPRRRFSLWPWGGDDGSGRADFTFIR